MIIANIDPLIKEIQKEKDKSLFAQDLSLLYIVTVIEKHIEAIPKIEIDITSIETRFDEEVVEPGNLYSSLQNLEKIYGDIMNAFRNLEAPA